MMVIYDLNNRLEDDDSATRQLLLDVKESSQTISMLYFGFDIPMSAQTSEP